ncbi:MAG: hypothetical protein ACE5GZ_13955 [Gammaproteobacteria bacterium]
MIIHCTKKLAAKLAKVSTVSLNEDSPLGSWHAHLYTIDHRQCVLFCHDASRYVLFLPGLRKEHFAELGSKRFRELYFATLQAMGCPQTRIRRVELSLGSVRYDTATDRSVQGSMRVARRDLDACLMRVPNVLDLDPLAVSCDLNHRPATVKGVWIWPDKMMLEAVAAI